MDDYIKDLRALVGHRPLVLCGASIIVYSGNKILLQKRRDNGCFGYFGGIVEPGESTEDAARRELREESGLIAGEISLFGVYSGEETHYTYPNGDEVYIVDIVYSCFDFSGEEIKEMDETTDLRWFPANALPDALSPPIKRSLHEFARRLI